MIHSKAPLKTSVARNSMIVALEPIEFIPCGRLIVNDHPGLSCLHLHQSQALVRLDRSLIGSFSKVSLDDKNQDFETWQLRKYKDAEEELYVCGHTIVWSRGYNVINTFTIDSPVKHAVWCSFVVDGQDPHLHELCKNDDHKEKKTIEGFAAISDGLHVFSRAGDDYVTSLPFQVRKVWSCDFGLIFERSQNKTDTSSVGISSIAESTLPTDNALTTVFCLQHPLREFAPVVKKFQGGVRYMNRSRESIVFCDENLAMTFDSKHGLHKVWKLRKMNQDDINSLENNLTQQQQIQNQLSSIRQMSISSPGTSPMRGSYRGSPAAPIIPNITGPAGLTSQPPIPVGLARTPNTGKNPPYAHLPHTPNSNRLCSPSAASLNYPSHTFSPLRHSPHLVRSPSTPISHESLCLNDSVHESAEPLRPEICFEHVWSESVLGTREGLNIGRATRTFLTEDVCGQKFLAYHINNLRQLRLVKYGLSNDQTQFIFGAVSSIPARDAAPLKELKMVAVLDTVGGITLYTGNSKMVRMHITGIPVLSLSLSHGLRNVTPALGTPQPVSTPAHPSRPGSMLGNIEEVGLLSPVPELALSGDGDLSLHTIDDYPFSNAGQSSAITGLPQVIGTNLLLEVSGGAFYKAEVPQFCSTSLVQTCMKALHHVLPGDIYMQMTVKWYAMRHCPGSMASYESEWAIFEACLRDVIGYSGASNQRSVRSQMEADTSVSPVVAPKKARHFEQGNTGDWEYLLKSNFHKKQSNLLSQISSFSLQDPSCDEPVTPDEPKFELLNRSKRRSSLDRSSDRSANFHPICPVFCALHLVYEEQKLNVISWDNVPKMSRFLQQLANDIGLLKFSRSYAMDYPRLINSVPREGKEHDPQVFRLPSCFSAELEPNILANLHSLSLNGQCPSPFPVIPKVTERTRKLLMIFDRLFKTDLHGSSVTELGQFTKSSTFKKEKSIEMEDTSPSNEVPISRSEAADRALKCMMEEKVTNEDLCTVPHGIAIPILAALHQCKELPGLDFPNEALQLIGRYDLLHQNSAEMSKWKDAPLSSCTDPRRSAWQPAEGTSGSNEEQSKTEDCEVISVMLENDPVGNNNNSIDHTKKSSKSQNPTQDSADDNVTRLLFPNDHRISEVRRLLQSEKPVRIDLTQQAGVSDHDFTEQTKTRLLQLCNRTMALAVGRGMASLQTEKPIPTEPFQIPPMDLTGRCLPGNATVDLETGGVEVPPNMKDWPLFHNGVAAGLKIMPQNEDSSWIYLNKPKPGSASNANITTIELSPEHAGFLLAAGLNGHLEKLHTLNIHEYLTRTHEMTTVGLLLGLGASKCGACDLSTMRLLSVHVPALLPPTSTEFDVPRVVQTAAVTAVGFLYLGSGQRVVSEVMLREIDRPPSPENDNGQDRESYALSCGIALGTITLGRGGNIPELADLNIPDQLYHYMTGKKKHSSEPTTQSIILEGDQVNTEITGPGAILALTLMFLKTNNMAIAEWFVAPETLLLLETIRPQHLMLRTLARGLILWDFVTPSIEWVESHIPDIVRAHITSSGNIAELTEETDGTVDVQTVLQCHASILSGACLALGIRFAGSQNKSAYQTLRHFVLFFLSVWDDQGGAVRSSTSYPMEVMGRYTLETCLTACLLALSMVVAGSGDMQTLQICRFLHVKLGAEISYGVQMATHMALGLLFLGNCRKTLCTSNKAVAALITSLYPCFPCTSSDNQYHLQALRHFYVLATEQRLLVPVDSTTNLPCYAQVKVQFLPAVFGEEQSYIAMAPCMLPESSHLKEVAVSDPRHWPIVVDVQSQPGKLESLLDSGLSVQRRTGFQPYIQDPKGHRSLLARSSGFNKSSSHWISLLSDDAYNTSTFADVCLDSMLTSDCETHTESTSQENRSTAHLSSLLKNFVTQEKTQALYAFCGLQQICSHVQNSKFPNPLAMWQVRIAADFTKREFFGPETSGKSDVTGPRFVALLSAEVESYFGKFLEGVKPTLAALLGVEVAKTRNTRPRRSAKRKELSVDAPNVLFTNPPWTSGLSTAILCRLTCFSVYCSLPPDFLFPTKSEGGVTKDDHAPTAKEVISALQSRGVKGKGATLIYKAFRT